MLLYFIAFLTFVIFLVLFFRKPKVETYILFVLYAFPFLDLKLLPVYLGYLRVFDAITLIGVLILLKEFLAFSLPIKYLNYFIFGIIFCLLSIISGVNAEFGFQNYYFYYPIFTIFIFVRFLFIYCGNGLNQRKVINGFRTAYVFALVFMTLQFIFGLQFTLTANVGVNVFNEDTGITRYQGIFSDSQFNGQFLAMGFFLFLFLNKNISTKKLYFNYFGFLVAIFYIVLAGSRSAMGGFIVGIGFLFLVSNLRTKFYGIAIGLMAFIALYLVAPDNAIFARATNLDNDLNFRQSIWEETYNIIMEHPLLGIGLGNFQSYTTKYNQDLYLEVSPREFEYFTQPENGYLKILVEHGVLAFIIFCLFFIMPFFTMVKQFFFGTANRNEIYFIAALGSWLTAFNTVYTLSDYRIALTIAICLFFLIINYTKSNSLFVENP